MNLNNFRSWLVDLVKVQYFVIDLYPKIQTLDPKKSINFTQKIPCDNLTFVTSNYVLPLQVLCTLYSPTLLFCVEQNTDIP